MEKTIGLGKTLAKISICFGILFLAILLGQSVSAATNQFEITDKYVITESSDFDIENYTGESDHTAFPSETEDHGQKYKLNHITYEITAQSPVTKNTTVKMEKRQEGVANQRAIFDETVTESTKDTNGQKVKFTLKDVAYTASTLGGRVAGSITQQVTSDLSTNQPEFAATRTFPYYDSETGETVDVQLNLDSVSANGDTTWVSIDPLTVTYQPYGSYYYLFGEQTITPTDGDPTLNGFESQILNEAGFNDQQYRITGYTWAGDPYVRDGVTYRDASAFVEAQRQTYTATYSGTNIPLPGSLYTAVASYEGTLETETGMTEYTITATGHYDEVSSLPVVAVVAITAVSILIGIGLVILILYVLAKRKKEKTQNELSK